MQLIVQLVDRYDGPEQDVKLLTEHEKEFIKRIAFKGRQIFPAFFFYPSCWFRKKSSHR